MILIPLVFACKTAPQNTDIPIGLYGPFTGDLAAFGQTVRNGVELAVEETNAVGGISGRRIALFVEDDRGKPEEALSAVTRLITRSRVVAVIGEPTSSGSLAGGPACVQHGVPMMTPTATNPKVTGIGPFIFRACWIDPFQSELMARFAVQTLNAKKVAILYDVSSDYSVGLATVFEEKIRDLGAEIVAKETYTAGDTNFSAQLTAIARMNPDCIFLPSYYADAALIARQARGQGITIPLLGSDGWDTPDLYRIGMNDLNNSYFCSHFFVEDPDPGVRRFAEKARARLGRDPGTGEALGYDATRMVLEAIRQAGTDSHKIATALASMKDFKGVTGSISINAERNAVKPAVILRCNNGKSEFVQRIEP